MGRNIPFFPPLFSVPINSWNMFIPAKARYLASWGVIVMYMLLPPEYLRWLEDKLTKLEKENEELKKMVKELKPIHIENLNYKIQELVVQELSGTLNIGLTGEIDEKQIKNWLEKEEKEGEPIVPQDMEKDKRGEN